MVNGKEILESVKKDLSQNIEADITFRVLKSKDDYLSDGMKMLKHRFHQSRKEGNEEDSWKDYVQETSPRLKSYINGALISARRRKLEREVMARTVEAQIKDRLANETFTYKTMIGYNHVDITIKLNDELQAYFSIRLKELKTGLERLVEAVHQLQNTVNAFGSPIRMDKIQSWHRW